MGLKAMLKAHEVEKHVNKFNMKWGIGDKAESLLSRVTRYD